MKTTSLKSTFSMMILSAASLLLGCNQMAIDESEAVEDPSDVVTKEHVAATEQALVTPPVADGNYRIRGLNADMCLDIPQGCDDPSNPDTCLSAPIIQRPCNGNALNGNNTQSFEFTSMGEANYQIKHPRTGKCLYMAGPTTENGGIAVLHYCAVPVPATKQFVVGASGPNVYGTITPLHSGRCLNIVGSSKVECAALYQWSSTPWGACSNAAQQFRLETN